MFFSAKFRKPRGGGSAQGRQQQQRYVLETPASTERQMAASTIKFDIKSPAALTFKNALFEKIKEIWCGACARRRSIERAPAATPHATHRRAMRRPFTKDKLFNIPYLIDDACPPAGTLL
eukprot:2673-Chlamydomonas_euryale.AAC.3